jgi:ribosome-associated heat shock protein Hsp15
MDRGTAIRLDKWLWQARLCKTRTVASRLVAEGAVRVNAERVLKPATLLRIGDGVTFAQGRTIRVLRVRALGLRRGPAPEARELYEDLEAAGGTAGLEPRLMPDT